MEDEFDNVFSKTILQLIFFQETILFKKVFNQLNTRFSAHTWLQFSVEFKSRLTEFIYQ